MPVMSAPSLQVTAADSATIRAINADRKELDAHVRQVRAWATAREPRGRRCRLTPQGLALSCRLISPKPPAHHVTSCRALETPRALTCVHAPLMLPKRS